MTDPAERDSMFPLGSIDDEPLASPRRVEVADVPLRSYINDLRVRVDALPDDDAAQMVPPDAKPVRWVASDLESALHAAAEIVPRTPSSPDSMLPPSMAPLPESSLRNVRRPIDAVIGRAAGEFAPVDVPTLPPHERRRKSGRFVSQATSGAMSSSSPGPIAAALIELVNQERAATISAAPSAPIVDEVASATHQEPVATLASADVVSAQPPPLAGHATIKQVGAASESAVTVVTRALLLFVTAWIAGGTTVYFLLRG